MIATISLGISFLFTNFAVSCIFLMEHSRNLILSIETAVNVCSVCIADENGILSMREDFGVNNHSSKLSVFIDEVMKEISVSYDSLVAVAVSGGPGSFTGLRIGIATAKGLCYASNIPLIAVDTLQAMAWMMMNICPFQPDKKVFYQPMIDARRMEVYTALFDENLNVIKPVTAEIIDEDYFSNLKKEEKIILAGNGTNKFRQMFENIPQVVFIEDNVHSSRGVSAIALQKLKNKDFADVAYYEPFYLKDFIPGKPKVKGLE